jgi:xanthine/uracil/vitamin C permease (AzgA family)
MSAGGRTGVAAIFTSFLFFIALFFTPILASIPPYAVGPALITVGAMMVGNIVKVCPAAMGLGFRAMGSGFKTAWYAVCQEVS